MIPNKWGLIRERALNLYALPLFADDLNIAEFYIEDLAPLFTYTPGDGYKLDGTQTSSSVADSGTLNITGYDFVLLPLIGMVRAGTLQLCSGISIEDAAEFISRVTSYNNGDANYMTYSIFALDRETNYALKISIPKDKRPPVLAFKRHRSDNVNPKGIIRDATSDILQPIKEDKFNGEADGIRDDVSGNIERPDVDTGSDHRAADGSDEQTDG